MSCIIPPEVTRDCSETVGAFFESISKIDRAIVSAEHLDIAKSRERARVLKRYVDISGKKLLEIGSGFGATLACWMKEFGVDGYGVEPSSMGFETSFKASKRVFEANGLDPSRILDAPGEALPFEDSSFDIVYSGSVLEHVQDPFQVTKEALRVLRPGGIFHAEMPNLFSFYESHYCIFQPPMPSRQLLAIWVQLLGRDPQFAHTLNMINPEWCRNATRRLNKEGSLELISVGEDIFLEKLNQKPYSFNMESVGRFVGPMVKFVQSVNINNWIGHGLVFANVHYPIYWTIKKLG